MQRGQFSDLCWGNSALRSWDKSPVESRSLLGPRCRKTWWWAPSGPPGFCFHGAFLTDVQVDAVDGGLASCWSSLGLGHGGVGASQRPPKSLMEASQSPASPRSFLDSALPQWLMAVSLSFYFFLCLKKKKSTFMLNDYTVEFMLKIVQ